MAAVGASPSASNPGPRAESLNYVDSTQLVSVTVHQPDQAVLVVHVAGEVDMLTGPPLEDHLHTLLATRPERLVIDLSQVSFMGSTGLSTLISLRDAATKQGTALQLSGTSRRAVAVPLEMTGLINLFDTAP
jgi:anti-sigma B factor antagonist